MNGLNAIIKDGKVYETMQAPDIMSCDGCDLRSIGAKKGCVYAEMCMTNGCVLQFSPELTDKLNKE